MTTDAWLLEMVSLAEETRHGLGTEAKSQRLAELVLEMHSHLFDGGNPPQAWAPSSRLPTVPPGAPALDDLDDESLDDGPELDDFFAEESVTEPRGTRPSGAYPLVADCFDDIARVLEGIEISGECLTGTT